VRNLFKRFFRDRAPVRIEPMGNTGEFRRTILGDPITSSAVVYPSPPPTGGPFVASNIPTRRIDDRPPYRAGHYIYDDTPKRDELDDTVDTVTSMVLGIEAIAAMDTSSSSSNDVFTGGGGDFGGGGASGSWE
jgi:hypothetical protein